MYATYVQVREVNVMLPENQAIAHRLGFYWFRLCHWKLLGQNEEDEILVDSFVYSWSYCQVPMKHLAWLITQL